MEYRTILYYRYSVSAAVGNQVPVPSFNIMLDAFYSLNLRPTSGNYINIKPYLGVAQILSKEAGITELVILQAAILHDTVEDTDTTFDEIEKQFGSTVKYAICYLL